MKATEAKLLNFLKSHRSSQFPFINAPILGQRRSADNFGMILCVAVAARGSAVAWFFSSIVYVESDVFRVTGVSRRLTLLTANSVSLQYRCCLLRLAKAVGETEPVEGFSRRKIKNYYLLNAEESGERHFKLLLSQTDKASLIAFPWTAIFTRISERRWLPPRSTNS